MPFIARDPQGKIIAVSSMQSASLNEEVDDNDKEFLDFIKTNLEIFSVYGNSSDYQSRRKIEYPRVGPSLDAIMKTFKYLRDNGIDIGPDGNVWVDACLEVKNKIPKDWKPE